MDGIIPKRKKGLRKGQNIWTKEYVKFFPRGYHGMWSSGNIVHDLKNEQKKIQGMLKNLKSG